VAQQSRHQSPPVESGITNFASFRGTMIVMFLWPTHATAAVERTSSLIPPTKSNGTVDATAKPEINTKN
jgi:hypothetical protein